MRRLIGVLGAVLLLACPPAGASQPPAYDVLSTAIPTDTIRYVVPCGAAGGNAFCRVTVKDSVANVTLAQTDIAVGQVYVGKLACPAPNAVVVITARAYGVTAAGTVSTGFTDGRGQATCPDVVPLPPPPFTIIITVIGGG